VLLYHHIIFYILQTVETEIKTVCAQYREFGIAESQIEMQAVKWAVEGMVKSGGSC